MLMGMLIAIDHISENSIFSSFPTMSMRAVLCTNPLPSFRLNSGSQKLKLNMRLVQFCGVLVT